MKLIRQDAILNLVAVLAGIQLPLAFAPFHIYVASILSPALLLALWVYATPRQALIRGFLFGIGCFTFGVSWVYNSIHIYGNAVMPLAVFITALLIIILALFIAIQGYVFNAFFPNNNLRKFLLAFPASWVFFEWLRSWVLSGFPWLFLGTSQLHAPLAGLAPILGVYGVSFVVALTCGAIITPMATKKIAPTVIALLILMLVWFTSDFIKPIKWTKPIGKPMQVSLIQGNIPQELKWHPDNFPFTLKHYQNLTNQHWDSKLIIWPEAAIPAFKWQAQPFIDKLDSEAKQHHTTIITGVITEDQLTNKYYNSMIAFGENQSLYQKRHLVPFGEYPMFGPISRIFMSLLDIPMSDFTPGPKHQPDFMAANLSIGPSICYEIAYPLEILTFLPKAQLLVNILDDSWFGKSKAQAQQLQMAQMRSLETGRYQLVSSNTGITAIISPRGKILAKAPSYKKFVLTGKIQAMTGATPWVKFGYYLWIILILLAFGIAKIKF